MENRDNWKTVDNETWTVIEKRLSFYIPLRMLIDGYQVRMQLVKMKMKVVIVPIINDDYDVLKWENEKSEIRGKFYQPKKLWAYPPKTRKTVIKKWGKKEAEKYGFLKNIEAVQYYWTNFGAMKRHYMKTCKEIQVCRADVEQYTSLLTTFNEDFNDC